MNDMDTMVRKRVMDALIKCRNEKSLTQQELADAIGSKATTVASWEQGKSLPSIQMLWRLSQYYNKSIGFMFGEE